MHSNETRITDTPSEVDDNISVHINNMWIKFWWLILYLLILAVLIPVAHCKISRKWCRNLCMLKFKWTCISFLNENYDFVKSAPLISDHMTVNSPIISIFFTISLQCHELKTNLLLYHTMIQRPSKAIQYFAENNILIKRPVVDYAR